VTLASKRCAPLRFGIQTCVNSESKQTPTDVGCVWTLTVRFLATAQVADWIPARVQWVTVLIVMLHLIQSEVPVPALQYLLSSSVSQHASCCIITYNLNCWVLHPVARVSTNAFLKPTVRNNVSVLDFIYWHNKIDHINIVAYGGFKESIIGLRTIFYMDHLCGLVVGVPGYRSRGPGFGSRHYEIFWEVVDLEGGPYSLVSTTEELLGRKK
jgi:hypothetical protein